MQLLLFYIRILIVFMTSNTFLSMDVPSLLYGCSQNALRFHLSFTLKTWLMLNSRTKHPLEFPSSNYVTWLAWPHLLRNPRNYNLALKTWVVNHSHFFATRCFHVDDPRYIRESLVIPFHAWIYLTTEG